MIGLYLRLSSADGDLGIDGKDESNSIENQRKYLYDFVRRRDDITGEIQEYIDDGYSGTNFDRPAFKELMEDMKSGKVKTLITKDLSRLGRNYIDVGDYMEQVFPLLGIRYIAVNSSYDSNDYIGNTVGLEMSVMNLVNALYSKDLSRKTKTAYRARWKSGKSTSGRPPFGYMRNPEDTSQWVIEPVAAEIVRRIFNMALEGAKARSIVDALNADHVMTPGQYREKYGFVKRVYRKVNDREWIWASHMVWKILKTYEYTGALVQGKSGRVKVGGKMIRKRDESERVIFEGHHEPIVTHEEFRKAGKVIQRRPKSGPVNRDNYPLGSVVYCGNCGLRMDHPDTLERYFKCVHKKKSGSYSSCSETKYPANKIEYYIRCSLRNQLLKLQMLANVHKEIHEEKSSDNGVAKLEQQIKNLKSKKTMLYESYVDEKINKDDYIAKRDVMKLQLDALVEKKKRWNKENESSMSMDREADQYIRLGGDLYTTGKITQELVDTFIDQVLIYDEEHIEIKFKFRDLIRDITREIEEQENLEARDEKDTVDSAICTNKDGSHDHESDHKDI